MKLLDRYIGLYIIMGTLLALAVLVALFTFITFVDDFSTIGRGSYTLQTSLMHLVLTLPRRTFELFPLAALVGSLAGLGVMASGSELTVVRSSGVSLARITVSVMRAGAVLMVIAMLIGELLAPVCERIADEQRSLALSNNAAMRTGYGFWIRDGMSFINIREVLPDNRMGHVYIYEFDSSHHLRVATSAGRAEYRGGQWTLENLKQSVVGQNGIHSRTIPKAVWNSHFAPDLVNVVAVKPESLSALGLYRYIEYLRRNNLNTERYEIALWNKFVYPLATGVMIFLAIPLVLGRVSPVGIGQRIMVGTMTGIAFHVVQEASSHLGVVYSLSPALSALAPTLAFFGVGVWMMARVR